MSADQRNRLHELLEIYKRRLHILELQAARYGVDTPAHIQMEIQDLKAQVQRLQSEEIQLQQQSQVLTSTISETSIFLRDSPKLRRLRVFLCHASIDKIVTLALYKRLREDGFQPWINEKNLLAGDNWELEISKAVEISDVVLVCLSKRSITRNGFIQKEIKYALDIAEKQPRGTIYIIPVRFEDCFVPKSLRRWHWVNLFGHQEEGYRLLVHSLNNRAAEIALLETQPINIISKSETRTALSSPVVLKSKTNPQIRLSRSRFNYPLYIIFIFIGGLISVLAALVTIYMSISSRTNISELPHEELQSSTISTIAVSTQIHTVTTSGLNITTDTPFIAATIGTHTATSTSTSIATSTVTPTSTPTATSTDIPTATSTSTPAATPTSTPTQLPITLLQEHEISVSPGDAIISASFSPDGKSIVTTGVMTEVLVFNVNNEVVTRYLLKHEDAVQFAAFNSSGTSIVTASNDKSVIVWNLSTMDFKQLPKQGGTVISAMFSPDDTQIATGGADGVVRIWDANTGNLIQSLKPKSNNWISSVSYSNNGKYIVAADYSGIVRVWNTNTYKTVFEIEEKPKRFYAAFSPDDNRIITAGEDNAVNIWSFSETTGINFMLSLRVNGGTVRSAAFSKDGKRVVTATYDGIVRVWDSISGELVGQINVNGGKLYRADFNRDGSQIVTASQDGYIRIWSIVPSSGPNY